MLSDACDPTKKYWIQEKNPIGRFVCHVFTGFYLQTFRLNLTTRLLPELGYVDTRYVKNIAIKYGNLAIGIL
jgi:hypothetical protein